MGADVQVGSSRGLLSGAAAKAAGLGLNNAETARAPAAPPAPLPRPAGRPVAPGASLGTVAVSPPASGPAPRVSADVRGEVSGHGTDAAVCHTVHPAIGAPIHELPACIEHLL